MIAVNILFQPQTNELGWLIKVIFQRYITFTIFDFELDMLYFNVI